jgi:hypothetical protein
MKRRELVGSTGAGEREFFLEFIESRLCLSEHFFVRFDVPEQYHWYFLSRYTAGNREEKLKVLFDDGVEGRQGAVAMQRAVLHGLIEALQYRIVRVLRFQCFHCVPTTVTWKKQK